jgi:hypothetical protein
VTAEPSERTDKSLNQSPEYSCVTWSPSAERREGDPGLNRSTKLIQVRQVRQNSDSIYLCTYCGLELKEATIP